MLSVKTYRRSVTIFLLIGLWFGASGWEGNKGSVNGKSRELISIEINLCLDAEKLPWPYLEQEVNQLYQHRNYFPVWYSNGILREEAARLLQQFDQVQNIGLTKQAFPITRIRNDLVNFERPGSPDLVNRAQSDVYLSAAALIYLSQLKFGMVRTHQIWTAADDSTTREKLMDEFLNLCCAFDQTILVNEPKCIQYTWFEEHIVYWWQLWMQFERKCTEYSNNLSFAVSDPDFEELVSQLLHWTGFYLNDEGDITVYLDELLPAYFISKQVEEKNLFQLKWYLYQDFNSALELIQLNLDRLKASAPVGKDYIWINIPASELIVYENDFPVKRHFVVVGNPRTPTPEISGPMTEVISFPRWNIPKSIVIKEISPAMRRNSGYLAKKGYELVDWYGNPLDSEDVEWDEITEDYVPFRVIQEPGYMNALGVMKFNFKNKSSIYLHDTNAKSYFKRENRALSHGCIRVENPLELAKYLLSEYSYKSFREHLVEETTRHYRVNKELLVYLRYLTCDVNADGEVVFYEDYYRKDAADLKELWGSIPKW